MPNPDAFYTPPAIAATLINHATVENPRGWIADFAAGGGELLKAAHSRWPKASIAAFDVNKRVVGQLARWNPDWRVGAQDFFSDELASSLLSRIRGKVSVCVLNPPFSNRGAARTSVNLAAEKIRCSFGLAFIVRALPFLAPQGQLLCILPRGSLTSERDEEAWNVLDSRFSISILGSNSHTAFNGCTAHTIMARFSPRRRHVISVSNRTDRQRGFLPCRKVKLLRGGVSMCNSSIGNSAKRLPLIHTTELRDNTTDLAARTVSHYFHTVRGPGVLMPRVGNPSSTKICEYLVRRPIVLSDCVLFVRCQRSCDARIISRALLKHWEIVERQYGGTCARYITLRSLRRLLRKIGIRCDLSNPPKEMNEANGRNKKQSRRSSSALQSIPAK